MGEDRKRTLEARYVGTLLFDRQRSHGAQIAPDGGPLEQMGGGEERQAPLRKDRYQDEAVEIALVVGHDHERSLCGDPLGINDLETVGAPECRPNSQCRSRVGHEPRPLVT